MREGKNEKEDERVRESHSVRRGTEQIASEQEPMRDSDECESEGVRGGTGEHECERDSK